MVALLMIFQSRISYKLFHLIPAPIRLLLLAIPFVFPFDFFESLTREFLGNNYEIDPSLLIEIPDNVLDAILYSAFSKIHLLALWISDWVIRQVTRTGISKIANPICYKPVKVRIGTTTAPSLS